MIYIKIVTLSTLISLVSAATYNPVSFIPHKPNKRSTSYATLINHGIPHFVYLHDKIDLFAGLDLDHLNTDWGGIEYTLPHPGLSQEPLELGVEIGRNGHITPDFSNGLDYPDPYLLTGEAAHRAAKILYSGEPFFQNFPHIKSLVELQRIRRTNGLDGNKLGSLRQISPFYRFKKAFF